VEPTTRQASPSHHRRSLGNGGNPNGGCDMPRPYVPVSATHHRNMTQPARYAVINCGSRLSSALSRALRGSMSRFRPPREPPRSCMPNEELFFLYPTRILISPVPLGYQHFFDTPIGAQGDPIPIYHLIIIPQTIHISARCHLLPSSKENLRPHKVSFRATHHFFVLGFGFDCTAFI
jgi:hypothetical protein